MDSPWDAEADRGREWLIPDHAGDAWHETGGRVPLDDRAVLYPLEGRFGEQVRSRVRGHDLAEVFTHQREVDAMLDRIADAFAAMDVTFLDPACGSGSVLAATLRRELGLASKDVCATQEQCVHRLLRAAASIHGVEQRPVRCRGRVRPGPQCRGLAGPAGCGGGGAEDVVRVEVAARAHVRPGLPVRARPSGDFSSRVCHGMPYGATESRCDGSGILEFPGNLAGLGFVQDFDG